MSDTLVKPTVDDVDTDNPDEVAHYVDKAASTQAYIEGNALKAICGYIWVPSKDPKNLPICKRCIEIYEELPDTLDS